MICCAVERPGTGRARRTSLVLLVLVALFMSLDIFPGQSSQPVSFEIEIPEFEMAPTSESDVTIPSSDVKEIKIHILRPLADHVDYGAIRTSVNGKATATISETFSGVRGKLVKIDLRRLPGFEFEGGRNTVEIWVANRRGRTFYASFVLRTVTESRNESFILRMEQSASAKKTAPPDLVLLEPERPIEIPAGRRAMPVRISGVATTSAEIKKISVDGRLTAFKKGTQIATRALGLANEDRLVSFETSVTVNADSQVIAVEVEDSFSSKARLEIPVTIKKSEPPSGVKGRKFALIVGISKYRDEAIPDLNYAHVDSRSLYEFLQRPEAGSFARDDIVYLENERATLANIRQALATFVGKAGPDDLLVIFIAGHGTPDPLAPQNIYILASDTLLENMAETGLAMPDLRHYVEQNIRAKRTVLLLDTCHSAGLSTEITRAVANNLVNLYLEKLLYQEEGRAIITSSDVNEKARESEKWGAGHGVFTYYLLEGLRGKADVNQDRLISVGELFRFVRQRVRLDTQFKQNPRMLIGANENLALSFIRSR